MKLTILRPTEIEVNCINCVLPVRYGTEDIPADYPHRTGDVWDITIDIETGQILLWPGCVEPRHVYMKVVDGGKYVLMNDDVVLAELVEDYIPYCIPGRYGDYIDFKIDGNGRIANWNATPESVRCSFFVEED